MTRDKIRLNETKQDSTYFVMIVWQVPLLMLIACLSSAGTTYAEDSARITTCTTSIDDVRDTHTATVTCHYSADVISQRPLSLSVDFYPPGQTPSVTVMDCMWRTGEASSTCITVDKTRYTFTPSPHTPDHMVLVIADVTARDVGRYVCQHISPDTASARFQPCLLSAEDIPSGSSDDTDDAGSSVKPGPEIAINSSLDDMAGPETTKTEAEIVEEAETGWNLTILLVTILVPSVLALVLVVLVVGCIVRSKCRPANNKQMETDAEKSLSESEGKHEEQPDHKPENVELLTEKDELLAENPEPPAEIADPPAEEDEGDSDQVDEEDKDLPRRDLFELELITTAATMQIPIQRKMSHGDYPFVQDFARNTSQQE